MQVFRKLYKNEFKDPNGASTAGTYTRNATVNYLP